MATEVKEHEERSYSARYLILIFFVCVATCGLFFSAGFLVGRNERSLRVLPSTEMVSLPGTVPPAINQPPDSAPPATQEPAAGQLPVNPAPQTEVIPGGESGTSPTPPAGKPAEAATTPGQTATPAKPASSPASPPTPAGGEVGEGITLQVVALRTQADAQHLVDILKEKGYPVFLVTPEFARADDNLYRVQVGPFRTHDDADKVRAKLVQEGFKPFIKH